MSIQHDTKERILQAARDLYLEQGFRKTSMEDIAHRAGMSRMTVYRYYGDKKDLVRAVSKQAAEIFRRISEALADGALNPVNIIDSFESQLGKLSSTSFLGRFDEFRRVYPDIFEEYRAVRNNALNAIFDHVLTALKRSGRLREGINETVLRQVIFGSIVNAIENPDLAGLNIPRDEVLSTIREVFLFGIIDTQSAESKRSARTNAKGGA